ncbi:fimbrial protein [Morganella morganii]|uniref:fimbrial protein n=1 Tax=Morganella morganii TaxID=582 RepID=UPI0034D5AF96
MINVLKLCVFTWLMLVFSLSYGATCTAQAPLLVSPANITVQRDVPVGTRLLQIRGNRAVPWKCSGSVTSHVLGVKTYGRFVQVLAGRNIYATDIAGIGYAIGAEVDVTGCRGSAFYLGYAGSKNQFNMCGSGSLIDGGNAYMQPEVAFYKIGKSASGTINSGSLGVLVNELQSTWQTEVPVNVTAFTVTTLACSITTPSLNFPIGDISAANFRGSIGSIPAGTEVTRNLGLDCDAGANINVSLQGTQNPDVSNTSVLALSGQGSTGVAQGVGVQLLYNGAPLELNKRLLLKTSGGGKETFPVTARYYQTKTTVVPGKANTSATLDLVYQ